MNQYDINKYKKTHKLIEDFVDLLEKNDMEQLDAYIDNSEGVTYDTFYTTGMGVYEQVHETSRKVYSFNDVSLGFSYKEYEYVIKYGHPPQYEGSFTWADAGYFWHFNEEEGDGDILLTSTYATMRYVFKLLDDRLIIIRITELDSPDAYGA